MKDCTLQLRAWRINRERYLVQAVRLSDNTVEYFICQSGKVVSMARWYTPTEAEMYYPVNILQVHPMMRAQIRGSAAFAKMCECGHCL